MKHRIKYLGLLQLTAVELGLFYCFVQSKQGLDQNLNSHLYIFQEELNLLYMLHLL